MEWKEFTAKTVDEALTNAMLELKTTEDNLEYEIIEKDTSGFLGLFSKPATIRVKEKKDIEEIAKNFLEDMLSNMSVKAEVSTLYDQEKSTIDMNINGEDMGIVIGKRGQTLDAIQYLVSLVVNKNSDSYIKIKVDTENYRIRRKETVENLARNIASKVKRTKKSVALEPMNPYERRIIHSALQGDKFVETYSEGEDPYRKVIIASKKKSNYNKKKYSKHYSEDYRKDYKEYKENKKKNMATEKA